MRSLGTVKRRLTLPGEATEERELYRETKVRMMAAVSSETRRARRFVSNAERKKKTNPLIPQNLYTVK